MTLQPFVSGKKIACTGSTVVQPARSGQPHSLLWRKKGLDEGQCSGEEKNVNELGRMEACSVHSKSL